MSHHPGRRFARGAALLIAVLATFGAGCLGTRFYDEGTNHPPNTIFRDQDSGYPTPQPGALVRTEPVTLYWTGTDQQDGDAMAYYMFKVSPPDTGETRTTATHYTLPSPLDTTYEFCVYAVDRRGAADPNPTCRSFQVNVIHVGHVILVGDINERTREFGWTWHISDDSEFTDSDFSWDMQLIEYYTYSTGIDSLLSDSGRFEAPGSHELRVTPLPRHKYCLTIYPTLPDTLPQAEPQRYCYLAPPDSTSPADRPRP